MSIKEAYQATVAEQVKKGANARWGEAESVAVIKAVVKAGAMESGLDEVEANALADNVVAEVARVVNPSAFAQRLEKLPDGHACKITRSKGERKLQGLGL